MRNKKKSKRRTLQLVGKFLPEAISRDLPAISKRFEKFQDKFDERFPASSSDTARVMALAWMMETPLALHILGHNSAAVVELHAWLERFTLIEVSKRLGKDRRARGIIYDLLKRKTLAELADTVVQLGLWDKDDKAFITNLKNIRDGIVHKNDELLSRHIGGGKGYMSWEIGKLMDKIDCAKYFITTMDLIMKLVIRRRKKRKAAI